MKPACSVFETKLLWARVATILLIVITRGSPERFSGSPGLRRWASNVVGERWTSSVSDERRRTMSFNFGSIWKIQWLLSSKCNREQRGLKVEKNYGTIAEKNYIIYYLKENLPIMVWVLISFECNVLCNYYMTKRLVAQSAFVQESVNGFCVKFVSRWIDWWWVRNNPKYLTLWPCSIKMHRLSGLFLYQRHGLGLQTSVQANR